jgi:hypothetical protein
MSLATEARDSSDRHSDGPRLPRDDGMHWDDEGGAALRSAPDHSTVTLFARLRG